MADLADIGTDVRRVYVSWSVSGRMCLVCLKLGELISIVVKSKMHAEIIE